MNRDALKKQRMKNDNFLCCNCGNKAEQVHHIVPLALGGNDCLGNLISLCEECHAKVHGRKSCNHSELTKAGLQRARQRGVKLGGTGGTHAALAASTKARKARADKFIEDLRPLIDQMMREGLTLRAMVDRMNSNGIAAPKGGKWGVGQVQRLVKHAAAGKEAA